MQDIENVRKVKYGNNVRYTFGKSKDLMEIPYLLDIQKTSYKNFIEHGISDVLKEFSPISDYAGKADIYFLGFTLDDKPKISKKEAKRKGSSYSVSLKVKVRLVLKETGEVIEQDIFLGDVPYMTDEGTFIYNGIERVVVSQIVRSPSAYYEYTIDKTGRKLYHSTLIPTRGSWFEIEQREREPEYLRVSLNKGGKISLGVFLKCFGLSGEKILEIFGDNHIMKETLAHDHIDTQADALIELSRRTRPSEIPNVEATKQFIFSQFFNEHL